MATPRVTITLGRSGQVVKRGGAGSGDQSADSRPLAGSKRVMRDRLYSDADGAMLSTDKRQRVDGMNFSHGTNGIDDSRLSQHDLRLKLMRKNLSKQRTNVVEQHKKMDIHGKLSNAVHPPTRMNMLQHRPELRDRAEDLLQRASYSPRTVDGFRDRSPDRILRTSRVLSPPRNFDESRQVSLTRTANASRTGRPLSIGIDDTSVRKYPMPITMNSTPDSAKQVTHHASTYGGQGEQPYTVASLLHSLDLGKYAILFQAEEVDMTALRQMGDKDLKELGIPMGPRKKILLALMSQSKQRPP